MIITRLAQSGHIDTVGAFCSASVNSLSTREVRDFIFLGAKTVHQLCSTLEEILSLVFCSRKHILPEAFNSQLPFRKSTADFSRRLLDRRATSVSDQSIHSSSLTAIPLRSSHIS